MKKLLKIFAILIILILLLILAIKFSGSFGSTIKDGEYKIVDNESYSDAYIEVKNNTIRFYNIDLNEIYRQGQYETFKELKDKGTDFGVSEEELYEKSDLNNLFVNNPFEMIKAVAAGIISIIVLYQICGSFVMKKM